MTNSQRKQPTARLGLALGMFVLILGFLTIGAASGPWTGAGLVLLALCPVLPLPTLRLRRLTRT